MPNHSTSEMDVILADQNRTPNGGSKDDDAMARVRARVTMKTKQRKQKEQSIALTRDEWQLWLETAEYRRKEAMERRKGPEAVQSLQQLVDRLTVTADESPGRGKRAHQAGPVPPNWIEKTIDSMPGVTFAAYRSPVAVPDVQDSVDPTHYHHDHLICKIDLGKKTAERSTSTDSWKPFEDHVTMSDSSEPLTDIWLLFLPPAGSLDTHPKFVQLNHFPDAFKKIVNEDFEPNLKASEIYKSTLNFPDLVALKRSLEMERDAHSSEELKSPKGSKPGARPGFQTEQNFLTYYEMKYLLRKSCALQSYIRLLDAPAI